MGTTEIYSAIQDLLVSECKDKGNNIYDVQGIVEFLKDYFQASDIYHITRDPFHKDSPLSTYKAIFKNVASLIDGYAYGRNYGTLYDLQIHLLAEFQVKELWQIGIGNLLAFKRIDRYFNLDPSLESVPQVTTLQLLSGLVKKAKKAKRNAKIDPKEVSFPL